MTSVDEFNAKYALEPEDSRIFCGDYKLWFRPFVDSPDNDFLVAFWVAWPITEKLDSLPYLVSVCGGDYCGEYKPGESIPLWETERKSICTLVGSNEFELLSAYADGLVRLKAYILSNFSV